MQIKDLQKYAETHNIKFNVEEFKSKLLCVPSYIPLENYVEQMRNDLISRSRSSCYIYYKPLPSKKQYKEWDKVEDCFLDLYWCPHSKNTIAFCPSDSNFYRKTGKTWTIENKNVISCF